MRSQLPQSTPRCFKVSSRQLGLDNWLASMPATRQLILTPSRHRGYLLQLRASPASSDRYTGRHTQYTRGGQENEPILLKTQGITWWRRRESNPLHPLIPRKLLITRNGNFAKSAQFARVTHTAHTRGLQANVSAAFTPGTPPRAPRPRRRAARPPVPRGPGRWTVVPARLKIPLDTPWIERIERWLWAKFCW
jgi:hypothetical protein